MTATSTQQSYSHLSSLGIIEIQGADAKKFLQGQLTINADLIDEQKLNLAAICNPQGRCISLFFTFAKAQAIYLILKQDTIKLTLETLRKYAVFFKLQINDVSTDYAIFGASGKNIPLDEAVEHQNLLYLNQQNPNKQIAILVTKKSSTQKASGLHENHWFYQLASQGIPWLEESAQTHFLPHYLNLPQLCAVDFKKGCFTGQEVIARMQYKGQLKSHLQLFSSSDPAEIHPKQSIFCGEKKAAEVVCSVSVPGKESLILAVLQDRYLNQEFFQLNQQNLPILKLKEIDVLGQ